MKPSAFPMTNVFKFTSAASIANAVQIIIQPRATVELGSRVELSIELTLQVESSQPRSPRSTVGTNLSPIGNILVNRLRKEPPFPFPFPFHAT